MSNTIEQRRDRASKVNELVRTIGSCGRRFFYSKIYNRFARIEVDDRGRIFWIDDYSNCRIYLHYKYWGNGFSHGGTLKDLVNAFRHYVQHGTSINQRYLGPWPDWICKGDLWGYGDDMEVVRDAAKSLGLTGLF